MRPSEEALKQRSYGQASMMTSLVLSCVRTADTHNCTVINEINRLRATLHAMDEELRGMMKRSGYNFRLDPDNQLYEKS